MRTKFPFFLLLVLAGMFITLIIVASKGGSSTSTCSSQFINCKAICAETHFYATSGCNGEEFFPICECDGLFKNQSNFITANKIQTENLEEFIDFVSNLEFEQKQKLLANLTIVKNAIQRDDYETYLEASKVFSQITGTLSEAEKKQLNSWFKQNILQAEL